MPYQIYQGRDGGYGIMHASINGPTGYNKAKNNRAYNKSLADASRLSYDQAKLVLMNRVGAKNETALYAFYNNKYGNITAKQLKAKGFNSKKEYINNLIKNEILAIQANQEAKIKKGSLNVSGGSKGGKF